MYKAENAADFRGLSEARGRHFDVKTSPVAKEKPNYIVILVDSRQKSVANLRDWSLHAHRFRGPEAAQVLSGIAEKAATRSGIARATC